MRLAAAAAALVLTACSQTQFNRNASAPDYGPYKGEVAVLERLPPPGTFDRLGVVVVETGDIASQAGLIKDLKRAAAKEGANAIVLQHQKMAETTTRGVGTAHKMGAWAIRVRR